MNIPRLISSKLTALDEKNRYYVLGGILLFIFLLDYFLIMQPQLKTMMALNPKITILAKDFKRVKGDIPRYNQYQEEVLKLREKKMVSGTKILLKEEISMILENISRIANRVGVRINQIMPIKDSQQLALTNEDGNYYTLPILVDAKGGYHDIGRFFNQVENDPIFMSITDFDITANTSDPTHHSTRITIKAYVLGKGEETSPKGKEVKPKAVKPRGKKK